MGPSDPGGIFTYWIGPLKYGWVGSGLLAQSAWLCLTSLAQRRDAAGDVDGEYPEVLVADVSESAKGARLVVSAGVEDGMVAEIRFRAFGCPHLVAAAELVCSELENGPLERLAAIGTNGLMERLAVPVGKTGRLFLVEDALRLLHRQAVCAE